LQIFTKFAGCNFQLANRNFDDLFAEDQDAQTDLMPMLMAIQNNAKIAPFGGIETRQNLVELFDVPAGKEFTGVATLIGDRLYAATSDMKVHHGQLPAAGVVGSMSSEVTLIDSNNTLEPPTDYTYSEAVDVDITQLEYTSDVHIGYLHNRYAGQKFTPSEDVWCSGATFYVTAGSTYHQSVTVGIYPAHSHTDTYALAYQTLMISGGLENKRATWSPVRLSAGVTYRLDFSSGGFATELLILRGRTVEAGGGYYYGTTVDDYTEHAHEDLCFTLHLQKCNYHFDHEAVHTSVFTRGRYSATYADTSHDHYAAIHIFHSGVGFDNLIYEGDRIPNFDLVCGRVITTTVDKLHLLINLSEPPVEGSSIGATFTEAIDNNVWTYLGYADDQLIGITANQQIWTGERGDSIAPIYELANTAAVADPANALVYADALTPVPAANGIAISATATEACPFRLTISYTILTRFGPTKPSPPLTFYASKPTTEWTTAAFVAVDGTVPNIAVVDINGTLTDVSAGVIAVELYYTEGEYQEPAFLGRVNVPDLTAHEDQHDHPPVTKPWVFNWVGYQTDTSMWTIANLTPPTENYTMGAPVSKMVVLDGQLYFWGNATHPYRIWIGGQPGNRFSVSPGTGGGFVDVEPGTGTEVKKVLKFKTQQGAAIVTALCDNVNSQREHRFNLVESTIAISDEQSVKGWMAEKIAGAVGCKSANGAVAAGDGLYAVSRYGLAITTLTMEYNSQLQIMYVSDPISPVFLKQLGLRLNASVLFEVGGVLYMTFGSEDASLDNILFCYDIALKAWWTYTLDTDTPILNMIHIDYENGREGLGVITKEHILLLPTTMDEDFDVLPTGGVLIESGELTTMQPIQSMHHISQLEFFFDYFIGEMDIQVTMVDQFGRVITVDKHIHHDLLQHALSEYIRIDQVVKSYKVVMTGPAKMRMTHFIAKLYPKSNRIGMVWGFDTQQSHASSGSIHRTFTSYNDLKNAIIP
jgi:hypothetical protein